jgi:Ca2+/H+ antiporter
VARERLSPHALALTIVVALLLGAAIMAAVYHAEVIAHFVGEPFGTLILALAVTVIEVSLIVSIMLAEGGEARAPARDTLMAAIMIIINGIVGIYLIAGGRPWCRASSIWCRLRPSCSSRSCRDPIEGSDEDFRAFA